MNDAKEKLELSKVIHSVFNPMLHMLMEMEELKDRIKLIEEGIILIQESNSKILQLGKDTCTDVGKVRMTIDGFKKEGIRQFTKLFSHMESLKTKTNSSNNDLAISIKNSYFSISKNIEQSYECFYHNMHNTLRYYLKKR